MFYKKFTAIFLAVILSLSVVTFPVNNMSKVYASDVQSKIIDFSDSALTSLASTSTSSVEISYSDEQCFNNLSGSMKFNVLKGSKNVETTKFSFAENGIITNWNSIGDITFAIYNTTATNDDLNIVFSKSSSTINDGYYKYSSPLNWTGWKEFSISTESFTAYRGITSWESIDSVIFNLGGWSGQSTAGTVFYVAYVKAVVDYEEAAKESLSGSFALYDGEPCAIYKNQPVTLSKAPVYSNNILYVPVNVFDIAFGFESESDSITKDGLTFAFSDGSINAHIGAYDYTLCAPSYLKDELMFVPLADICTVFDLPLMSDGRFAMVGSSADISYLKSFDDFGVNQVSEEIIKMICNAKSSDNTSTDCETIIDKWLSAVIGNEAVNSQNDSIVKKKITSINTKAEDSWSKLIKTENSDELFTDITTKASSHMTSASLHIYQMAAGYATYGGKLYKNSGLLSDLLYAVDWFYENRYGSDEAENNEDAWRDRTLYNWWDWRIGTPQNWIPTLMILKDEISDDDMVKYLSCFNAAVPYPRSTGSNYINMCRLIIGASALVNDTDKIKEQTQNLLSTFVYVDNGRNPESQLDSERAAYTPNRGHGFYKDGSYVYHTLHAMNGTYGLSHMNMASDLVSLLSGTSFELPSYCADNVADWIINSFDSLMYKNRFPRMVCGRSENPGGLTQSRTIVKAAVRCFDLFNDNDKEIIGSIIKEYSSYNTDNFISNTDINNIANIRKIISTDSYNSYNYETAHVFGNMDKTMQKRKDWAIGISMSSSRIFNYESINNQNENGWYLGDGMYELILADEGAKSAESYWQNINYYRLPGTTADTQTRQEVSIAQGNEYLSTKDFVGGVSLDGKYLTSAMHLESYHNGEAYGDDNNSYGTSAPAHTSDLTAKKSYFVFDNEIYCLGADIKASNNNDAEVLTIVDNRIISDNVYSESGALTLSAEDTNINDVSWLNADNKLGYYFPDENQAQLKIQKNENTNTYFEAVLTHGVNPEAASYAYALLPGKTREQTAQYALNPDVEILSNTSSVQAVRHNGLGISSVIFWEEGTFGGITVTQPMMVMIKESGNDFTLSVSDPTQKLKNAKITFDRALYMASGDSRISQSEQGTVSAFDIDFTNSLGKSLETHLKQSGIYKLKLTLCDKDGNTLNKYNAHKQSELTASVSAVNLSKNTENAMLVIAMYSSDGELQDVKPQYISISPAEKINTPPVTLTPDSDTVLIKAFVWQSGKLTPFDSIYLNS